MISIPRGTCTPLILLSLALIAVIFISNKTDFKIKNTTIGLRKDSSRISSKSTQQQWEPFNTTNPHSKSWCPKAVCQNSPMCAPCNRRHLLLLATARSGSTTLLSMLNQLPLVRMSGENNNELYVASRLISNLKPKHGSAPIQIFC